LIKIFKVILRYTSVNLTCKTGSSSAILQLQMQCVLGESEYLLLHRLFEWRCTVPFIAQSEKPLIHTWKVRRMARLEQTNSRALLAACFTFVSCLAYSSNLKMAAIRSYDTTVNWRYIPEVRILHVRFEVLTTMVTKSSIFRDVTGQGM
jgi:hypothetical protein